MVFKSAKRFYSVIYEENQEGYLLNTFSCNIQSLELYKCILDDFIQNDYIFSEQEFKITDKNKIQESYNIISHKKKIISNKEYNLLLVHELENGYIYHLETSKESIDVDNMPRAKDEVIQYISKHLDKEVEISLN